MSVFSTFLKPFFKQRTVRHVGFWLLMVFLLAYHSSLFGGNFKDNLTNMLALLPTQMAAAYLLVYVQVQKWLFRGYWFRFAISIVFITYVLSVLARLSIIHIAEPIIGFVGVDESLGEILADYVYLIEVYTSAVYIPAFVFLLIKMIKDRFEQQKHLIFLEKEKQANELNFLKAQMNPHFLFNTLNNIYALSKNKSEETSEMILKLSSILDYTIYECQENRVLLEKEWQLIEDYVDLQALRHHDQLMISIDQHVDQDRVKIAPLILITLVENAFKYALGPQQESPNIKINLEVKQGLLSFQVFNTKANSEVQTIKKSRGIGIQNIARQLDLQYPDRHSLKVNEQANTYEVTLSIQL